MGSEEQVEEVSDPRCLICGHSKSEHAQERQVLADSDSKREFCCMCNGYEEPGYPRGKAWHRFRDVEKWREVK